MSYNFSTLNDKEFEKLSRDILSIKLSLDLQDFKAGKDKGIDLRYSSPLKNNSIIVQAKHYYKSGFKALCQVLVKEELPKVKRLKPDRYILVTSVELTAANKDDIFNKFAPFIKSANDIFGNEDLNKYLKKFPDIETKWYKLWLSSVNILNTILHNAVLGKSAFIEASIRKTIQLYVQSEGYNDAFDILNKYQYILITGQPGVGKTTLANLLAYHLLAKKYQLVYIDSDLHNAEKILNSSPDKKQLFFFDDFLGSNYLEIYNPKTTESEFVNFIKRIKATKNKYLILTTRTTVYKNAIDKYEKLRRIKVDIARKEIQLGQYSDLDKGKILYNHIYHSDIIKTHLREVFSEKNYWKIIKHRNYNPRLIEFITDVNNTCDIPKGGYMEFVMRHLENPQEVWMHAYEQQFTLEERLLLNSIFSQQSDTDISNTQLIFDAFLKYQIHKNNHTPTPNPFNKACKTLLDGILKREITIGEEKDNISFINPSINDFLTSYFVENTEEWSELIEGSIFVEQFEKYRQYFFDLFNPRLKSKHAVELAKIVITKIDHLQTYKKLSKAVDKKNHIKLRIASLLEDLRYQKAPNAVVDFCYTTIRDYPISQINNETMDYYINIIRFSPYESKLYNYVKANWTLIILALFKVSKWESDFEEIESIFDEFSESYSTFVSKNYDAVQKAVSSIINESTEDWISDEEDNIFTYDDIEETKKKVKEKRNELFNKYGVLDLYYNEDEFFDRNHLEYVIERNNDEGHNSTTGLVNTQEKSNEVKSEEKQRKAIDELFSQ